MSKKMRIQIWNRDFELNIVFQNFPGELVTDTQEKTVEGISDADIDASLTYVKQYIRKYNAEELDDYDISNVFRFVMPKSIVIPRTNDGKRVFAIMCNYKFDMEHGITVVYENENFKQVGPQDIIL